MVDCSHDTVGGRWLWLGCQTTASTPSDQPIPIDRGRDCVQFLGCRGVRCLFPLLLVFAFPRGSPTAARHPSSSSSSDRVEGGKARRPTSEVARPEHPIACAVVSHFVLVYMAGPLARLLVEPVAPIWLPECPNPHNPTPGSPANAWGRYTPYGSASLDCSPPSSLQEGSVFHIPGI